MIRQACRRSQLAVAGLTLAATVAAAQERVGVSAGAQAIGLLTRASATPAGGSLTEAYLTQAIVSADLRAHWFRATGMLNLEGLTLRRGELDLGAWGEGYVDRRHPHAYLHQLMAGVESRGHSTEASLYAGRGFVPFGSDDPMARPFVSYPVDHHLAQVLERWVAVGAARAGAVSLEAAIFGGDEPIDPSTLPFARRFGDSWSLRGTAFGDQIRPSLAALELSASYAYVKSPEYREGQGLDQRKLHAGLRVTGDTGPFSRYALLELARSTALERGRSLYTFDAALAEAAACHGSIGVAARWERSDRPEEERLLDAFRTARPATDVSIIGVTEWTTLSGAVSVSAITSRLRAAPFLEVARIAADRTAASAFDPVRLYGESRMWRFSTGVRVGVGHEHARMGRYGVAEPSPASSTAMPDHAHHETLNRCFS